MTSTTPTAPSRCSCSGHRCSPIRALPCFYRPGKKPLLLVLEPEDYWHQPAPVPTGPWQRALDIRVFRKPADLRRHLPRAAKALALLGDPAQWRGLDISGQQNPRSLLTHLDYDRACKTPWEVHCIEQATVQALAGHRAVQTAFKAGLSEFEMGLMFLAACGQTDAELPYPAIVAMNRNGATLHYQHRDRQRLPSARTPQPAARCRIQRRRLCLRYHPQLCSPAR